MLASNWLSFKVLFIPVYLHSLFHSLPAFVVGVRSIHKCLSFYTFPSSVIMFISEKSLTDNFIRSLNIPSPSIFVSFYTSFLPLYSLTMHEEVDLHSIIRSRHVFSSYICLVTKRSQYPAHRKIRIVATL